MKTILNILAVMLLLLCQTLTALTLTRTESNPRQSNSILDGTTQLSSHSGMLLMSNNSEQPTWVSYGDESSYPKYQRVFGGDHKDGTKMYICRSKFSDEQHPGKLYQNQCYVSWNGKEHVISNNFQVLLTKDPATLDWKPLSSLSHDNITSLAVIGGAVNYGASTSRTLYICRVKLRDGVHPGKYMLRNGICYVPWGGNEQTYTSGFDVLMAK